MTIGLDHDRLVFLDIETTGLDPSRDTILEVACIVNSRLWSQVIKHKELPPMDSAVCALHAKNGLFAEVATSSLDMDMTQALLMSHLYECGIKPGLKTYDRPKLAGYGPKFDLGFLATKMPLVAGLFSHRVLDVNQVRAFWTLCGLRAMPENPHSVDRPHRAMGDCLLAQAELAWYTDRMDGIKDLFKMIDEKNITEWGGQPAAELYQNMIKELGL